MSLFVFHPHVETQCLGEEGSTTVSVSVSVSVSRGQARQGEVDGLLSLSWSSPWETLTT